MNILEVLIKASERAACIARSCSESSDETLVVTEKGENEANTRFEKDFKTIADVLAQESAKAEIGSCLPDLATNVRGEECNEIGDIKISLQESVEKTAELLNSLVPPTTANRLAEAAHSKVNCDFIKNLPNIEINSGDLGVWIDPIDGTAEFIAGIKGETNRLECVTVLIGAYLRSTGEPVIGVINQPFYNNNSKKVGRIIWGVSYNGLKTWSDDKEVGSGENTVLLSGAEKPDIIKKLQQSEWKVISVAGAGHKLLKVALGEAVAYVVSKNTTFRWDTCAPHAILNARGGGIVSFSTHNSIAYNDDKDIESKEYCNSEGIIAYHDESVLLKILDVLK